ncbi:MAG: hypothetical protein Q4Q37_06100 [Methanobrevibacter sp.]|nr:hypothetical protein [Methanobrevibacter sp.]
MKLKTKLIILALFTLVLMTCSCVSAEEVSAEEDMSFDDTLSVDEAADEISEGNTVYISPNGTGTGASEDDPTNWNAAKSKVTSGGTIQLANGTYYDIKDDVISNVELRGSGNTVINASGQGGFFKTIGSVTLNKISFINAYTGDKQGNPDGPETGYDGEGAIVNNGQLTVIDCYFASNQGIGTEGGAIHNSGTCYIYDSTFFGNGGKKGGAIYSDKRTNLYIYNSIIQRCVSREGSAIHAKEAYVEVHNCTVRDSSAKNGLFYVKESTMKLYDSRFYNSRAVDSAGVINIDKQSSVEIDNCTFDKISSTGTKLWFHEECGSGDGGVIVVEKEARNVVIKNSVFTNCTAKGYGGVIYIDSSAAITIDNCTFKDNSAAYGDNIFSARYASMLTITNSKFEVKSTIETSDIDYGETETIRVTVDDGTNNLLNPTYTIHVNNQEYPLNDNSLSLYNLNVGNYTAVLIGHDSNSNVYSFTQPSSFFIIGGEELEATATYSFNDDGSLNINIIDEYNRPVSNKQVTVNIDGETYTATTNSNGIATIAPVLEAGEHNISITVPGKIISNRTQDKITVVNNTDVPMSDEVSVSYSYNDDGSINVEVKDKYDRVVSDAEVTLTINDVVYTGKTNDKGIAVINPDKNIAGEYSAKVEVKGKNVKSQPESIRVVPTDATSSIIAEDSTRAYNSQYDFRARLLDKNANPLRNKKVNFVINGNDYEMTTDEYGYAYLRNTLSSGEYQVTVENPATNERLTRNLTIMDRIVGNNDVTFDYTYSGTYKVRVYADNGQVVGAGESVIFTVNGKKTAVKTDANGYATFKISGLLPKTYTVSAEYKGVKVSNKVVVKQVLKASNKKFKRYKLKTYTATLKTSNGKAIKGKLVTFKFNGKTYKVKTNKKGVAKITIKKFWKVGKFKITIKYLKTSIKKTITVKR